MNRKTKKLITFLAVGLMFCLVSPEQSALAQSSRGFLWPPDNAAQSTSRQSRDSNCKKLKGIRIDVFDPAAGIALGRITHGRILNGTTEDVVNFSAGFVLTPDPNAVSYLSDTTITTRRGQLKTSLVTTFNFVTGVFSQWGNINPDTSTGRFAGATGVIFFNGTTIGTPDVGPYKSVIVGEICLAHDDGQDDEHDEP